MKENVREEEHDTTMHLIKIPDFTHASHVTKFSVYILRPRQRSKKFRLVWPDYKAFHGSEVISKLTEGPQNGAEAFCGATGSFVNCSSRASAVCAKIGQRRSPIVTSSSFVYPTRSLSYTEREIRG